MAAAVVVVVMMVVMVVSMNTDATREDNQPQ